MLNLNNVTLVALHGGEKYLNETIKALLHSSREINFYDVKLVTNNEVKNTYNKFKLEKCPSLNYEEYNKYCVFDLHKHIDTDFCLIQRVGNGGFTFRSKKLLQLASKLNLNWQLYHGFCHEDGYISVNNRHIYEKNECKFAPLEVAKYFSHEIDIPENKNIIPFGFHGKHTMYYKYFIENEYFINLN